MEKRTTHISLVGDQIVVNVFKYNEPIEPLSPETFPCSTFAHPIDVEKLKIGFWDKVGLKAINKLFHPHPSTMDRWCYWRARTDLEKRKIIHAARQPHWCQECFHSILPERHPLQEGRK